MTRQVHAPQQAVEAMPRAEHGAPGPGTSALEGPADLPGVGPELAHRLRQRFGSDAALLDAARQLQVAAIAAVEGVGPKRARRIVRAVAGVRDPGAFLCTEAAQRVWDDILRVMQEHAATPAGKERLALIGPAEDRAEAAAEAAAIRRRADGLRGRDVAAMHDALRRLAKAPEGRPARRTDRIVIGDDDALEHLSSIGADRWVALEGPGALARHDGLVLVAGEVDLDGPHILPVCSRPRLEDVAPEAVTHWFQANRARLEALVAWAEANGTSSRASEALAAIPAAPAGPRPDIEAVVEEERARAQGEIRAAVAGLTLSGADLLAAMDDEMPAAFQEATTRAIDEAHARIQQRTGLDLEVLHPGRPITLDRDALRQAVQEHEQGASLRDFQAACAAARRLRPLRDGLEREIESALAMDAPLALARFTLAFELQPATWSDALRVHGARHIGLLAAGDPVQGVDHHLGDGASVALLTGANSGGKTTLLEALAQCVVMAHFGLPVPAAQASVPWLGSLHLLTHRRSLDAGAFESFLRQFMPLCAPGPRRLVLADEVEAITELEAAIRIIGHFLERLGHNGHLGLFVTHMAAPVQARVPSVRIDGIQATGLDDEGRLIVDRSPRIGVHATSTPELIIRRIARDDPGGPWQDLLQTLRA